MPKGGDEIPAADAPQKKTRPDHWFRFMAFHEEVADLRGMADYAFVEQFAGFVKYYTAGWIALFALVCFFSTIDWASWATFTVCSAIYANGYFYFARMLTAVENGTLSITLDWPARAVVLLNIATGGLMLFLCGTWAYFYCRPLVLTETPSLMDFAAGCFACVTLLLAGVGVFAMHAMVAFARCASAPPVQPTDEKKKE